MTHSEAMLALSLLMMILAILAGTAAERSPSLLLGAVSVFGGLGACYFAFRFASGLSS